MARPTDYRPEFCGIAASILASGESLAAVCAEIEICRQTLLNWKDAYPEFKDAVDIGLQKAQRDWERLGRSGIAGEIDKFSASTWIFTMKNRFRDDYKDDKNDNKDAGNSLVEKILGKLAE